jgi:uncharacterized protein YfbU (UPF0304 family)
MTHLSDVERRILDNQLQILTAIDPKQAKSCARSIRRIAGALKADDGPEPSRQIAMAEVDEPMTLTFSILACYAFLQDSFYALDLKEKLGVDHTALVFPGFHEPSEQIYSDHVSFIRYNLGQFTLLETRHEEKPRTEMLPFYRKLLTLPVEDDKARLGFGEITDMIETISELQAQTDQRGAEMATASAA